MTFDALENPRTGEYAVLRQPASGPDGMTVADLYARPGASVPYEHIHPAMTETFTVLRGRLGLRLNGRADEAGPGTRVVVPPGMSHAWWNSGDETAWVLVEVDPGARFELLIKNMFGLATDGRTDDRGRPGLLQAALSAREFDDVHRLPRPPRILQQLAFGALTPVARWRGLRGAYPEYAAWVSDVIDEMEALPPQIIKLLPDSVPPGTATTPPPAVT